MRIKIMAGAFALALVTGVSAHEIIHMEHKHQHGVDCGHQAIAHDGHVDYLHDGHLHSVHGGHVDEHSIAVSAVNPDSEALVNQVSGHDHKHKAKKPDHAVVQHGDHFDFIHDGRLHFLHGDHVDDHGPVTLIS